jgi:hypothetical protein
VRFWSFRGLVVYTPTISSINLLSTW